LGVGFTPQFKALSPIELWGLSQRFRIHEHAKSIKIANQMGIKIQIEYFMINKCGCRPIFSVGFCSGSLKKVIGHPCCVVRVQLIWYIQPTSTPFIFGSTSEWHPIFTTSLHREIT
jgi:hypothetical protein